jgi:hypothetical protein
MMAERPFGIRSHDGGQLGGQRSAREAGIACKHVGDRYAIPELQALGIAFQGLVLARQERFQEALPLLDEGMARATAGRRSPISTGLIYCRTILTGSTCSSSGPPLCDRIRLRTENVR